MGIFFPEMGKLLDDLIICNCTNFSDRIIPVILTNSNKFTFLQPQVLLHFTPPSHLASNISPLLAKQAALPLQEQLTLPPLPQVM